MTEPRGLNADVPAGGRMKTDGEKPERGGVTVQEYEKMMGKTSP